MALDRYLAEEVAFDCADGLLTRREALRRLALLGLSLPAAGALLAACGSSSGSGSAPTGSASSSGPSSSSGADTTSTTVATAAVNGAPGSVPGGAGPGRALPPGQAVRFAGTQGELQGVLALPTGGAAKGGVLVIHENRGLTPHIASIPPRLAADGFAALAIDLLSEEGGTAAVGGDAQATAALGKAPAERMVADLRSGLDELARRVPGARLGVTGFCFGGGMTWQLLAAGEPRLAAAVPFYGPSPANPVFTGSPQAAVLALYGGLDTRVNAGQPTVEAALKAADLEYKITTYAGADHAFFNDTGPRFDAGVATQAYTALVDWFTRHLAT